MKKLYLTIIVVMIMAAVIPISPSLAVNSHSSTLTSHFLYMFAHANILHWAINSWALLVLHNTFRWHRLLTAYLLAVTLSFLLPSFFQLPPVLGASVITTFFFGLIIPCLWRTNRFAAVGMVLLLLVSCFLPGFAGIFHIIPFVSGFIYYYIERVVRSFINFTSSCK